MATGMALTLEAAVLERFERLVAGGSPAAVPAALRPAGEAGATAGDGPRVQWLPLPDGPGPGAGIGGACIRLPAGTPADVVVGVAVAAGAVGELRVPGPGLSVRLRLFDGTAEPFWTSPARWQGPARSFRSVLPVVHDLVTGIDGGDVAVVDTVDAGVVRRWCGEVGLPEPADFSVRPVDVPVGLSVEIPIGTDRAAPTGGALAACHVELRFATAVPGPFAIGPGRHHGPGLMAPDVR
jgi:CRISPR-associated protein Csb2